MTTPFATINLRSLLATLREKLKQRGRSDGPIESLESWIDQHVAAREVLAEIGVEWFVTEVLPSTIARNNTVGDGNPTEISATFRGNAYHNLIPIRCLGPIRNPSTRVLCRVGDTMNQITVINADVFPSDRDRFWEACEVIGGKSMDEFKWADDESESTNTADDTIPEPFPLPTTTHQ